MLKVLCDIGMLKLIVSECGDNSLLFTALDGVLNSARCFNTVQSLCVRAKQLMGEVTVPHNWESK